MSPALAVTWPKIFSYFFAGFFLALAFVGLLQQIMSQTSTQPQVSSTVTTSPQASFMTIQVEE
jgi:hypothetical protein